VQLEAEVEAEAEADPRPFLASLITSCIQPLVGNTDTPTK